ncbi:MAG: BCD family MFS transporter [Gemmatimonadota bacterium]|jgi:BCD family chlorophyll transporter-like MFS transporter
MNTGRLFARLSPEWLPFADAVSDDLPLSRLLRLGLFQITVGMTLALLAGTLNRVMIVELALSAWMVGAFLAVPMLLAPLRAVLGFRSDHHVSVLGWRRVPYLWFGTLLQFGGFAILPFALILLDGTADHSAVQRAFGMGGAGVAFLLLGAGAHTVQTAGLALATDLSTRERRPQVVALVYVLFLVGLLLGGLVFSALLRDFSPLRLIQVIQGAAVLTLVLNGIALWKQEARQEAFMPDPDAEGPPPFSQAWRELVRTDRTGRLLVAVGLGSAGFAMQDVLLEPYGGQVMSLGVGATSLLTALSAAGALIAFAFAARSLAQGVDPLRIAAWGTVAGVFAFALVVLAAPLVSPALLRIGALFIGFGGGLFAVGTLMAAMGLQKTGSGLAVGAWGAVQTTAAGVAVGLGGLLRDLVARLSSMDLLGPALHGPETGYVIVYHLEILALFLAMVVLGPLVSPRGLPARKREEEAPAFGLAELPG